MLSAVQAGSQWREVMRVHKSGSALSDEYEDGEMEDVEEEQADDSLTQQLLQLPNSEAMHDGAALPGDPLPETLTDVAEVGADPMVGPSAALSEGVSAGGKQAMPGVCLSSGTEAAPGQAVEWSAALPSKASAAYTGASQGECAATAAAPALSLRSCAWHMATKMEVVGAAAPMCCCPRLSCPDCALASCTGADAGPRSNEALSGCLVLPPNTSSRSSYGFSHDSARVPLHKGTFAWSQFRSVPVPPRLSPSAAAMHKVKATVYASVPLPDGGARGHDHEHGPEHHAQRAGAAPGMAPNHHRHNNQQQQQQGQLQQSAGHIAQHILGSESKQADSTGACMQPYSSDHMHKALSSGFGRLIHTLFIFPELQCCSLCACPPRVLLCHC